MKRLALFITVILFSPSIHAQEYTKVNPVLIATYETGYGDEFLVGTGDGRSPGIRGMCFFDDYILATEGEKESLQKIDINGAIVEYLT